MFRKSTIGFIVLLSSATAGAALAQSSAQQPPAPTAKPATPTMQHDAKQDSTHAGAKAMHKQKWTKEQIKTAQVGLAKAGLYKGDTTGVWNSATRKALRAYQKQNHLPVTGRLSNDVLAKLKS